MESFTTRQTAVIAASNKTVYWLFRVVDRLDRAYYWSTGTMASTGNESYLSNLIGGPGVYDQHEWERAHEFRIINFSGITLRRSKSEYGIHAPNDVSFSVLNSTNELSASDLIGGKVRILLVIDDGSGKEVCGAWRFRINHASPTNQQIEVSCVDFLQEYLKGTYPNTKLIDELYPSVYGTKGDSLCVPEPYGTVYIPLRSVYANSNRYYVLGPDTYTYTITEVRSPRSLGTKITWTSGSYTFSQISYQGWRMFQPLIAGGANGLFMSGTTILDVPTKFSRSDTASVTNPADVLRYVLRNMGVSDSELDLASFETAKTTYTGWGLEWNFAFWSREERTKVLANLLVMCNSVLIVGEQIRLQVLSKTSQMTLTTASIMKNNAVGPDTFRYSETLQDTASDSGYVAYQIDGESQDEFLSVLIPADTTAAVIDSETVVLPGVQDTQQVQTLGRLYYRRKFMKSGDVTMTVKGTCVALRPDDVVTVSGTDYGGTFDVLIDEMTIKPDVSVDLKCIKFGYALADYEDITTVTITPSTTVPVTPYSVVIAGPDGASSTGTAPNELPSRLKIGTGSTTIILDPATPIKVAVYEANTERLRIGNLNGFIGVSTNVYGFGVGAASPGYRAKITASEAYIGSDTNYLQYVGGTLTLRGTLNASDILSGTLNANNVTITNLSASSITTGDFSASRIVGGTLNCLNITVSNLSASVITTGTLNCNLVTVSNLSANRITTGTLDCNLVNVSGLSASQISTGTLNAANVSIINLSATSITTGTLNCANLTINNVPATALIGTIVADRIGAGTITGGMGGKLVTGGGVGTVEATNIRTNTITATQISASYVYAGTLTASQVNAVAISASSVTTGTLNCTNLTVTNLNCSTALIGTLSVDRIGNLSITGAKIANNTITATKIQANSITANEISSTYVYAGTLTAAQVNAVNISATSIQSGTLNVTNLIAANAIIGGKIATGSSGVNTANLVDYAVTDIAVAAASQIYMTVGSVQTLLTIPITTTYANTVLSITVSAWVNLQFTSSQTMYVEVDSYGTPTSSMNYVTQPNASVSQVLAMAIATGFTVASPGPHNVYVKGSRTGMAGYVTLQATVLGRKK